MTADILAGDPHGPAPATAPRPLEGVTIVACEQAVAAPFATRQLADLGARVIKIERPGGGDFARHYDETVGGMSSHFVWLNRSKESVVLDLKTEDDQRILAQLVDDADVFIHNLAPGAMDRLGFGESTVRARNPRLIVCEVSGYGSTGPYRNAKAYDLLIQSEAGLVSITGTEEAPAKSGIPAADIAAGMYAFSGILAALYRREQTGEGSSVSVNLFDSLVEWMGYPIYYTRYGGTAPARAGTSHAAIAPYGTYAAGDGTEFVLSIQNEREWASFCETVLEDATITGDERFASGSRRVANRGELDAAIAARLSGVDGAEFGRRLESARVAHARLRTTHEVIDHPQIVARDRWTAVETETGPIEALLPALSIAGVTPRMGPIPALGQHTAAVRAEALAKLDDPRLRNR
jgi:crotonobetainyl-CoA:carnitine CoA-transferase CaiB-like acyl-CoA transferase